MFKPFVLVNFYIELREGVFVRFDKSTAKGWKETSVVTCTGFPCRWQAEKAIRDYGLDGASVREYHYHVTSVNIID